ncbi:P-selectin-like [Dreissena polymorpha]|uniref:P-selectin-like n=1 Tax=Dreissena polymorpha TaxID=45954 RepID=UPI002264B672|nr:P-selectin-like [Dreissena polymorpha]
MTQEVKEGTTLTTFSCNVGFSISGTRSISCLLNGTWSASAPTCSRCSALASPSLGAISYTTDGANTIATFTCQTGYQLSGVSNATCLSSGTWNSSTPSCGYTLNGAVSRTCYMNGTSWSQAASTCVLCNTLNPPSSGYVNISSNATVSVATYTCAQGYVISGVTTRTCLKNGSWEGTSPACDCEPPVSPVNGTALKIGSVTSFSCNTGSTLLGANQITCSNSGQGWSATPPVCVTCQSLAGVTNGTGVELTSTGLQTRAQFICEAQSQPTNGAFVMATDGSTTVGTFSCELGYSLRNVTMATSICTPPRNVTNGSISVSSDGMTLTYSCNQGYTVNGSTMAACHTDGSGWSTVAPNCVKCATLASPANGHVTFSTNGSHSLVTYSCDVGFSIKDDGVSIDTCQSNVQCINLPDPDSGTVTLNFMSSVTVATYTCFQVCDIPDAPVSGSVTLSADGLTATHICPTETCSNLTIPSNGQMTYSSTGTVTMVTYNCTLGYTLVGDVTRECGSTGSWNGSDPSCRQCANVNPPDSGTVNMVSDGTVSRAQYACSAGYQLSGSASSTCVADGTWSSPAPVCCKYCV